MNWKNEKKKLSELKEMEGNPRKGTEKQAADLAKSLERFNLADPIIVNQDNTVIGGHFRRKVLIDKYGGDYEVDVRVPDKLMNRKEMEELNIRLNRNTGEWDWDLLANFNDEMLKDVGFESEELDKIFGDIEEDEFDAEKEYEKIGEPKTKLGDLYQLGVHRLLCGDSTKREDVEKLMGGEKADMVFTDPPYAIGASSTGIKSSFADLEMLVPFFGKWWNKAKLVLKNSGHWYVCCDWRTYSVIRKVFEPLTNLIIWWFKWMKTGQQYRFSYEMIMFGELEPRRKLQVPRNEPDVWEIERRDNEIKKHQTQKPLFVMQRAIKNSSKQNDIVLDLFCGSGSTLIACEQLNRRCFMQELDPKYCDVIINRWEKLTNKKVKKI